MSSNLEEALAFQIRADGLPVPEREFVAIPGRRFRFDFGWPDPAYKLLCEVQGGVFIKGAHSTGVGITRDAEKAALAAVHGYRLIPVTAQHIKSGMALKWIREALWSK